MKYLLLAILLSFSSLFAQRISRDVTEYEFIQLPRTALATTVDGYKSSIIAEYTESEKQKEIAYTQAVADQERAHQKAVDQAQANYDRDMKAYNAQSTGSKILTSILVEEDQKPTLKLPAKPTPISKPYIAKNYRSDMLKTKYGKLAGYKKGGSHPVEIVLTLQGFESSTPDIVISESVKKKSDGTKYSVYTYAYGIRYSAPVSYALRYKGELLSEVTPEAVSQPQVATTKYFSSKHTLKAWWESNGMSYLRTLDDQVTMTNLATVSSAINSEYGYPQVSRKTLVRVPSHKKQNYSDYVDAYAYAVAGYTGLVDDVARVESIEKLGKAIAIWEAALTQAQPKERSAKKARINREVTVITYLNIIEAAAFRHDYEKADLYLMRFSTLDTKNSEEKRAKKARVIMKDQKERYKVWIAHQ